MIRRYYHPAACALSNHLESTVNCGDEDLFVDTTIAIGDESFELDRRGFLALDGRVNRVLKVKTGFPLSIQSCNTHHIVFCHSCCGGEFWVLKIPITWQREKRWFQHSTPQRKINLVSLHDTARWSMYATGAYSTNVTHFKQIIS